MHHLKVCNSVAFSIFTELCKHCCNTIPDHFHTPKRNHKPISINPHSYLPPTFSEPLDLLLVSLDLPSLDISFKQNHTICGFL